MSPIPRRNVLKAAAVAGAAAPFSWLLADKPQPAAAADKAADKAADHPVEITGIPGGCSGLQAGEESGFPRSGAGEAGSPPDDQASRLGSGEGDCQEGRWFSRSCWGTGGPWWRGRSPVRVLLPECGVGAGR
ncbi:twin-arginine translocation signal domain-containing protein [Streptomyces sparsogenes]|uniref:twin-arginine translocation signal domain-containing protein n=1 Tax=Streptomyces sparsogenes TaxID=67365 RepID=UPI003D9E9FCF